MLPLESPAYFAPDREDLLQEIADLDLIDLAEAELLDSRELLTIIRDHFSEY